MLHFLSISDPQLITAIKSGQVGVLPTDTVYGIVCRAADEPAVSRLYQLKHRERKPGTLIAANVDQLVGLGLKRRYMQPVEQYWPQPSTMVRVVDDELEVLRAGAVTINL
jgi:L-threonylcarbamoyladenylate synthase